MRYLIRSRFLEYATMGLALAFCPLQAEVLELRPEATVIVVPEVVSERERSAAQLLQEWLRRVYRVAAGFEIVDAGGEEGKTVVALGRTRLAGGLNAGDPSWELYRDGFRIRRRGNVVSIVGGSPAGTFFGAAYFLDKFAGVRFYMPGDLFTSLPPEPRVEIEESLDLRREPFVKNSMMSGVGGYRGTGGLDVDPPRPEEARWVERNAIFRKDHLHFSHQHSMFQRFPPEKFAARWPEIYPILDGKRYIPSDAKDQQWQPCFSEPRLVAASVESAVDYFNLHPDRRYLSFSVQDSHRFCEDARCLRAIARAGGNKVRAYSTLNARFLNEVAERLETELTRHGLDADRKIVYIPYTHVREVPPFRLHKRILPVVVFKIGDTLIDRLLEPGRNILEQWGAAATQMGNHDWGQGKWYFIPRSYTKLTSRVLREAKQRGLVWGYQHFEAYPNWGLDGPKLWVTSRIWWDPDADVEGLWHQLCRDLFPLSHNEMFRYFMNLEDLWNLLNEESERKLKKWSNQFNLDSEEQQKLARENRSLLDQALRRAADRTEKERIELFSKTYRLTEHFFALANADQVTQAQVDELRHYAETVIAPDAMTVFSGGNRDELMVDVDAALAVITKGKLRN